MRWHQSMVLALLLCACGFTAPAAAQQEKAKTATEPRFTEKQLEQWLKQYPQADADRDGKLTAGEALAYYQKLQQRQQDAQKNRPKPTAADVKYGKYQRNVLDYWQAKSDKPTPVLIHFHGGGFVAGDKASVTMEPYLKRGMSVVSANYRFVQGGKEPAPYPAPMLDGARVVQFVRSKAKEWNIDPQRIVLTGGSAGAVMSMWIGYRDDLAQPDSDDPIERESTRVACLVPVAGPTSLDPAFIRKHIGGKPSVHPSILPFFGAEREEQLRTTENARLVREASPLSHVSKDDPPTFLLYPAPLTETPLPEETDVNTSIHHPQFGVLLKKELDTAGVSNELAYVGDGRTQVEQMAALQAFLDKHLGR